ncbi:MAG: hypothetical protein RIR53_1563 [Bacteroidota bacterium]
MSRYAWILFSVVWLSTTAYGMDDVGIVWQRTFGGTGSEKATAVCHGRDGSLIIVGSTNSTDGDCEGARSSYDLWVARFNAKGDIVWKTILGGSSDDGAEDVIETADGGILVVGSTRSSDGDVGPTRGNSDLWVIKLDGNGKVLWQKTFGGSASEYAKSVTETSDHSLVIVGVTGSSDGDVQLNRGGTDGWLIKLDSVGTMLWNATFGNDLNDFAYSVIEVRDGSFIVAGELGSSPRGWESSDAWLIKFSADGQLLWQRTYGSSANADWLQSVIETRDGGLITCGRVPPANEPGSGAAVLKTDSAGVLQWVSFLDRTNCADALSVSLSASGQLLVSGLAINPVDNITKRGNEDIVLVGLAETTGNYLWQKVIGGTGTDNGLAVAWLADSMFVLAGFTNSANGDVQVSKGGGDAWIVTLRNGGLTDVIDVPLVRQLQAYPNPASSELRVNLPDDVALDGTLKVLSFDALGRSTALEFTVAPSSGSLHVNVDPLEVGTHLIHVSNYITALVTRCVIVR